MREQLQDQLHARGDATLSFAKIVRKHGTSFAVSFPNRSYGWYPIADDGLSRFVHFS